ncbi:pro-glucagon-like isoform X2 [Engystomops pustulosus]
MMKSKMRCTVDLPVIWEFGDCIKGHEEQVYSRHDQLTETKPEGLQLSSLQAYQMKKAQLMYITGVIILAMAPESLQILVRDSSDETRWQEYQAQVITSNIKRHSEGTFSSDLTRYLDKMKAKDFVQWLMNKKRFSDAKRYISNDMKLPRLQSDASFLG